MTLAETLSQYVEERKELQDQSLEISGKLSKAKFGKRGALRRTLRKLKRSIKRADRQIRRVQNEMRKENKNDVQEILAHQGIDGKSNQIQAIGKVTAEVGQIVSSAMGGPMGAMGGLGGSPGSVTTRSESVGETSNKNMMLYGGGAVVLLLLYMMNKKK